MHILDLIQNFLAGTFAFIVLLGLLIFVHELGHFTVARLCGVRVETFSLGFGKKVWQRKRGDTTYCLSAIPFGGYVKMFGDQPGAEVAENEKPFSFTHKKITQRMAIVLAGPLVNFFFAIIVFAFLALYGEDIPPAKLGDIESSTKAYAAGFRSGDSILDIDGVKTQTIEQLRQLLTEKMNTTAQFHVLHENGENAVVTAAIQSEENKNPMISDKLVGDIEGLQFYSKGNFVGVSGHSPLYALGLRPGDRIISVQGVKTPNWRSLESQIAKAQPGMPLQLDIERLSADEKTTEKISINFQTPADKSPNLQTLQIESAEVYLSRIVEGSPAAQAGLKVGDRITAINGATLTKWEDVLNSVKSYDGKTPLKISVVRVLENLQLEVTPKMTSLSNAVGEEDKRFTIGISPYPNLVSEDTIKYSTNNPFVAVYRGVRRTIDTSIMMVANLAKLASGEISSKNIGGIISIGQAAHETFKRGLSYYLHLMAILSVNLFILNLLPIPVLDGGHMVFYIVEAIKGSPISIKKMELAQQVGMVMLLVLMVYALYNDVAKLLLM